jgi:O-antigen/teichoic acid export membrane protein
MLSEAREPAIPPAPSGRILRNVGLLSGSQLITSTLTLAWTLIVPRLLTPAGMGLIVMAWSAAGIFQAVGGLGIRTLLVREIAMDPQRAPRLLGASMIARAVSILPCAVLTAVYVHLGHFDSQQTLVLYLAIGVAACLLFLELLQAAFQAIERMEYLAYADVLNKALLTACGIALALIGFRAITLVGLMLGGAAVALALSLRWSRQFFRIDWRVELSEIRSVIVGGIPYWTYGLFFSLYLWLDAAMLAVMTPIAVVGWYGGPTKLFGSLMVVPAILSMAWLPRLVSAFKHGPDYLKMVTRTPTEQILILGLPASIGAALIASPLITLLYGPAFAPAGPVFTILALAALPTYFNIIANQILIATNRQVIWTKALALASVVNLALNIALIQAFQRRLGNGAIGAALSLLLTELVLFGIAVVVIHPYLHRESVVRVGRSALATLGMAVMVLAVAPFGLAAQVVTGLLSFGVLALLLRVPTPEEHRELERLVSRLPLLGRSQPPRDGGH